MTLIRNKKAREQSLDFYLQDIDLTSLKKEYRRNLELLDTLKILKLDTAIKRLAVKFEEIYSNNKSQNKQLLGQIFKEHINTFHIGDVNSQLLINDISNIELYQYVIDELGLEHYKGVKV